MGEQSNRWEGQGADTEEAQQPGYFEKTEKLFQEYIHNRIQLVKLTGADKASRLMSLSVMFVVILVLVFFVLLFISIMGGYYFAELTGSLFKGFGIVTGIYVLLLVLVLLLRKRYLEPLVADRMIRIFFEKTATDEEPETEEE